jgi:hypothetical protein
VYTVTYEDSTGLTEQQIRKSRLFGSYINSLTEGWQLLSFRVLWAVRRVTTDEATKVVHTDIIMMFAEIELRDGDNRIIRSGALLRGTTVEILPIVIDPDGQKYAILVRQARVPVGCKVLSTPAGMTDGKSIKMTALAELDEEVDRPLQWSEPIWLNKHFSGSNEPMLVSPGGSSEDVSFCFIEAHVSHEELATLNGHIAGNSSEDERSETVLINLYSVPGRLGDDGRVCMKTLMLLIMYREYCFPRGGLE